MVETKENNKRFHQLHNIQPKKNNEQQDYKNTYIVTATETLLNYSWRKKEERLYYMIHHAGSTERQKAATK